MLRRPTALCLSRCHALRRGARVHSFDNSAPLADLRQGFIQRTARSRCGDDNCSAGFLPMISAAGVLGLAVARAPGQCYEYEQRPDGSIDRLHRWSSRPWNLPHGVEPGWQLDGPHPLLEQHLRRLVEGYEADCVQSGCNGFAVLVPLCGKTDDMPFLCERGFGVVGVEGVSRAIHEFSAEQRRRLKGFRRRFVMSRNADGRWFEGSRFEAATEFAGARLGSVFKTGVHGLGYYTDYPSVWRGDWHIRGREPMPLHVIQADMFDVNPELVAASTFVLSGQFDFVYDRAALVSLPPSAREEYVAVIGSVMKPRGRLLLIAEDYDQSLVPVDTLGRRRGPPPFALPVAEVKRFFPADAWIVEILDRVPSDLPEGGNAAFHGVDVTEVVYLITKRDPADAKRQRYSAYCAGGILVAGICSYAALLSTRRRSFD